MMERHELEWISNHYASKSILVTKLLREIVALRKELAIVKAEGRKRESLKVPPDVSRLIAQSVREMDVI